MPSEKPEVEPEPPVVQCRWCDHLTSEPGHVVTPEGVVEACPYIDIVSIKGL